MRQIWYYNLETKQQQRTILKKCHENAKCLPINQYFHFDQWCDDANTEMNQRGDESPQYIIPSVGLMMEIGQKFLVI